MKAKVRYLYIDFLKCLAVLLVFNSHMDRLYPVSALATGGALGNTLFFMVSGYCWAKVGDSFSEWYKKKVIRLWPQTILTNLLYIIIVAKPTAVTGYYLFRIFIYPNRSWFCGAMLLFAIVYYFLVKKNDLKIIYYFFACAVVVYIINYIFVIDTSVYAVESIARGGLCRLTYYLMVLMFGYLLKKREVFAELSGRWCILLSAGMFFLIYADKFLMDRYLFMMQLQFINQFLTFGCSLFLFLGLKKCETRLRQSPEWLLKPVKFISGLSWEIYIINSVISAIKIPLVFPINVLVILFTVLVLSYFYHKIHNKIFSGVR